MTTITYRGLRLAVRHVTEDTPGSRCTVLTGVIALSQIGRIPPGTDITELLTLNERVDLLNRAVLKEIS